MYFKCHTRDRPQCDILGFLKRVKVMDIVERLKQFMEDEARSCSMDSGCITPLYVYRMWGGDVPLEEISDALKICREGHRRACP